MTAFVAPEPNIAGILQRAERTAGGGRDRGIGKVGTWLIVIAVAMFAFIGLAKVAVPIASAQVTAVVTENTERVEGLAGTVATALDEKAASEERAEAQAEAAGILTDISNFITSMNATANGALVEVAG